MDNGDFVIVTNIEKIKFSGKKFSEKKYYRHTGFPGGIKSFNSTAIYQKQNLKNILKLAVKRMLAWWTACKKTTYQN